MQGSVKDLLSDINELHQLTGSEHQAETPSEVIEVREACFEANTAMTR